MKRDIQKRPVNMKRDLEKRSTHSCATWVSCATPSLRSRAARQFVTLTVRIQFLKSQLNTYHMNESSLSWVSFHIHRSLLYVSFHARRSLFIYRHTISQKSARYVSHEWVFSFLGLYSYTLVCFHIPRSLMYVSFHAHRSLFIYRHTISRKSARSISHGWVFSFLDLFSYTQVSFHIHRSLV